MYIPPPNQLSEESKQILDGIKKTLIDDGVLEALTKGFEQQYNTYNLINSGISEFDLMSASDHDLTDIDDPNDPLDEEDPFNPYDFI